MDPLESINHPQENDQSRAMIERIWAERAQRMAIVETSEEAQEAQIAVLLFCLGQEVLGCEVEYAQDIRKGEKITPVPLVSEWVVGVANLRGRILSVIDLAQYLNLPHASPSNHAEAPKEPFLVVVQNETMELIFRVDEVLGVEVLPVSQGPKENDLVHQIRPEYIRAVARRELASGAAPGQNTVQQHIVVLDMDAVLSDPRIVIHEEVA